MYCTSNNRKRAKRSQQSCNRLVCIVRVITVSVRSVLNNRATGLSVFTSNNRKSQDEMADLMSLKGFLKIE